MHWWGWEWGVSLPQMTRPGEVLAPPVGSGAELGPKANNFGAFCTQKPAVMTRTLLSVANCCLIELVKWCWNERWTFACLVLREIVKRTLYHNTGWSGQIADWQPHLYTIHSGHLSSCTTVVYSHIHTRVSSSEIFTVKFRFHLFSLGSVYFLRWLTAQTTSLLRCLIYLCLV